MKKIKVFSDYVCPFCYIGFTIADKIVNEDKEDVEFIWYPRVLNEELKGDVKNLSQHMPKEQREMAYNRILSLAKEYDLSYDNKDLTFDSTRTHKASLFARDNDKFYEFSRLVFRAVFEDGENIYKKEVVDKLANQAGLDVDKMNDAVDSGYYDKELENAKLLKEELNVESVPTFILEDGTKVYNLKEYKLFKEDLLK